MADRQRERRAKTSLVADQVASILAFDGSPRQASRGRDRQSQAAICRVSDAITVCSATHFMSEIS